MHMQAKWLSKNQISIEIDKVKLYINETKTIL